MRPSGLSHDLFLQNYDSSKYRRFLKFSFLTKIFREKIRIQNAFESEHFLDHVKESIQTGNVALAWFDEPQRSDLWRLIRENLLLPRFSSKNDQNFRVRRPRRNFFWWLFRYVSFRSLFDGKSSIFTEYNWILIKTSETLSF